MREDGNIPPERIAFEQKRAELWDRINELKRKFGCDHLPPEEVHALQVRVRSNPEEAMAVGQESPEFYALMFRNLEQETLVSDDPRDIVQSLKELTKVERKIARWEKEATKREKRKKRDKNDKE